MDVLKKLVVVLLALAVLFSFAACGGGDDEDDSGKTKGDPNCEHVWSEWEVVKENSCGKKGNQKRTCEDCGAEETEELLAYGHVYDDGVCEECDKKEKKCDHDETYRIVVKQATCTRKGEEREVCVLCQAAVEVENIAAYNHGKTKLVVVKEATCTENGEEQEICEYCDKVLDTYTLWSNGHDYVYVDGQYPTCTEAGWYDYYCCSVCDATSYYEEIPATGHNYRADTCGTCGAVNASFEMMNAPALGGAKLTVDGATSVTYDAVDASIGTSSGEIADKNQTYTWTFNASIDGRYLVWLNEVYNSYYLKMYIYNSLGERVTYDTSVYNNEGLYLDLTAGEYTIQLSYGSGYTTYNVNVGFAKDVVDISSYDVVNDKMQFSRQVIWYTFTPENSGVYYIMLSEMSGNAEMHISVYNRLNERISYNSYVENYDGLKLDLNAGETYTFRIENSYNYLTSYKFSIGKQKITQDISAYTTVADGITFKNQVNYYTFVATDKCYRIELNNISNNKYMTLYLYNYLGERVSYDSYCYNGEGLTLDNLVVGNTYTIAVGYAGEYSDYTLNLYTPKKPVAVTSDMGIRDSVEYDGQFNTYDLTVDRAGAHRIMLLIHSYSDYGYVSIYVYDSNGNRVNYDNYVYDGDYVNLGELSVGETYTIKVIEYGGDVEYTLSIQE